MKEITEIIQSKIEVYKQCYSLIELQHKPKIALIIRELEQLLPKSESIEDIRDKAYIKAFNRTAKECTKLCLQENLKLLQKCSHMDKVEELIDNITIQLKELNNE